MTHTTFDYAIVSAKAHGKGTKGEHQLKLLHNAGDEGWELVQAIPQGDDVWFYFKKAIHKPVYNLMKKEEKNV